MKCANPVLRAKIGNRTSFRHWNLANYIHKQLGTPFDCGQCIHCRQKKAKELARRCVLHACMYQDNCFITLTYNESHVGDNSINYSDIQKFKKRLRKSLNGKKIEIFNVHEYGKGGRKHWHLVIFNWTPRGKNIFTINNGIPIYESNRKDVPISSEKPHGYFLSDLWSHGYNTVGDVSEASAMYQAQYTQKDIVNGNTNNEKKAKSNHSGIGKPFFNKHWKQILTLGYIPFGEQKIPIPRYFEKLAHKHYCHYYDQTAFVDNQERKALYTPFKLGEENLQIADLYQKYKQFKDEKIKQLEQEWEEMVNEHIETKNKPEFVKSGENTLYEQKRKHQISKEKF